jgi:hypothetical protein
MKNFIKYSYQRSGSSKIKISSMLMNDRDIIGLCLN